MADDLKDAIRRGVNRFCWRAAVTDPDHLVPDGVLGTLDGGGPDGPGSAFTMTRQQILDLQLFRAIQANRKERVEALLGVGANVNFTCVRNHGTLGVREQLCTPLLLAVYCQHSEIAELLLCRGAVIPQGFSAVFAHACSRGSIDVVDSLLARNVNVDAYDLQGNTALHIACAYNQPLVVRTLLSANANPRCMNRQNLTPLAIAAGFGREEIVQILLRAPSAAPCRQRQCELWLAKALTKATEQMPVHDAPLIQNPVLGGVCNEGPSSRAGVRARLNWYACRRFVRMRSVAFFWYIDAAKPENMDLARDFEDAMAGIGEAYLRAAEGAEGEEGEDGEDGEEGEEGEEGEGGEPPDCVQS